MSMNHGADKCCWKSNKCNDERKGPRVSERERESINHAERYIRSGTTRRRTTITTSKQANRKKPTTAHYKIGATFKLVVI